VKRRDEDPTTLWYFAYGSNMSPAIFVDRRGMHPLEARRARLDGYRLCFSLPVGPGERGVANVEQAAGAHVWGVVYLIDAAEGGRLDRSEGVRGGLYDRIPVVLAVDDDRVEAFTYRSSFASAGRKPSARYLGLMLDGARLHGLPAEYVRHLEALDLAVDERLATTEPTGG
jgi:gamma-glutamylcyclotransferase